MLAAAVAITAIYLGGAGADDCDDITFDRAGYAYLACHSSSVDFTAGEKKDMDAFVVKYDPRTSRIVFVTRIGGSGWDAAFRVVVDSRGAAWVNGTSQSPDLLVGRNERVLAPRGSINAFVARLSPDGSVEHAAIIGDATSEGPRGCAGRWQGLSGGHESSE